MEKMYSWEDDVDKIAIFLIADLRVVSSGCDIEINNLKNKYGLEADQHPISGLSIIANRIDRVILILSRCFGVHWVNDYKNHCDHHQEKRTISTILDGLFINVISAVEFSMKSYLSNYKDGLSDFQKCINYSVDEKIVSDEFKRKFYIFCMRRNLIVHNNGRVDKKFIDSGYFESDLFDFERVDVGEFLTKDYPERVEDVKIIYQMYSEWCREVLMRKYV